MAIFGVISLRGWRINADALRWICWPTAQARSCLPRMSRSTRRPSCLRNFSLLSTPQKVHDVERFILAFDNRQTVSREAKLKSLKVPTLIVWGTGDIFFHVKWSHWLSRTIPGARRRVEFAGARLFFPEERVQE